MPRAHDRLCVRMERRGWQVCYEVIVEESGMRRGEGREPSNLSAGGSKERIADC